MTAWTLSNTNSPQVKKTVSIIFFKLKLILSLASFVLLLFLTSLAELVKNFKILIFLYIFLFIQALLIIFFPQKQIPTSSDQNNFYETAAQTVNLNSMQTYSIDLDQNSVQEELIKYQEDIFIKTTPSTTISASRDHLINRALLHLAIEQEPQFQKLIKQAKELDPNWEGWM